MQFRHDKSFAGKVTIDQVGVAQWLACQLHARVNRLAPAPRRLSALAAQEWTAHRKVSDAGVHKRMGEHS